MKKFKLFPLLAFIFAMTAAMAFTPPVPTPYGSTASIPCEAGAIVGANDCDVNGSENCQVILRDTFTVPAYEAGLCNDEEHRLKRN